MVSTEYDSYLKMCSYTCTQLFPAPYIQRHKLRNAILEADQNQGQANNSQINCFSENHLMFLPCKCISLQSMSVFNSLSVFWVPTYIMKSQHWNVLNVLKLEWMTVLKLRSIWKGYMIIRIGIQKYGRERKCCLQPHPKCKNLHIHCYLELDL